MLRGLPALVRAAHVEPSIAVTVAATAMAVGAGLGARSTLVALAVGTGQLSIGWSNDWLDRERDAANRRTDKPLVDGQLGARAVLLAAGLAAAICVIASIALGPGAATAHLTGVVAGWWYNLRAKHTVYSVVPWAIAFGLLPAAVTLTTPLARWPAWWVVVAGALLGAGAHVANALPDLEQDRRTGVEGLPHRLGRRRSLQLTSVLVAAGIGVVALGPGPRPAGVVIALVGAAGLVWIGYASWHGRHRAAFRGVVLLLLVLVVGVVAGGAALV
ncbi:UbiA family prenyltransferase [soil metagenome]